MNKVGSNTATWHLEQAALLRLCADRATRHGFHSEAERWLVKARWHRDKAEAIEREGQPA